MSRELEILVGLVQDKLVSLRHFRVSCSHFLFNLRLSCADGCLDWVSDLQALLQVGFALRAFRCE